MFGCLSQRYSHELPDLIPEVDGWFGARDLDPVVRALGCRPDPASAHRRVRTDGLHPYAYLKISEGCDRRCSYCAIPHIRGPHKSVPMETLVQEAEDLAAQGVRELVIIAQDTTYYGLDLYKKRSLAELLRRLSAVEGIECHPGEDYDSFIEDSTANYFYALYLLSRCESFMYSGQCGGSTMTKSLKEEGFRRMWCFAQDKEILD